MKRSAICLATILSMAILSMATPALADVVELAKSSGVKGGLVVHLGCGDGQDTARLRINDRYLVQGLDVDDAKVHEARERLLAAEVNGKVSVHRFDGKHLPYVDNLVNLIVSEGPTDVSGQEIMRVLSPLGVALIDGRKIVKPWSSRIDEWNHFLHGPDNNAVAKDRVAKAPRSLQWVSGPRWGRSHEEMASMSAAVSAKGRVFFIVDEAPLASIRYSADWKLVARDGFNGTLLWKRDISKWNDHLRHFRSGPVHLPRRLVAIGETVYATLGIDAPVTAIDAATGETLQVYEGTERTEEILVDNGVLYVVVGTSEVSRRGGGLYRRGEPDPTKFRYITAIDTATGKTLWKDTCPDGEFLLPLTLTVGRESVFYQSTFGMVRLDAKSGKVLWKTRRQTPSMRMAFSAPTVVATDEVLLSSDRVAADENAAAGAVEWGVHGWNEPGFARGGKTMLRAYSVETGEEIWSAPANETYNSPVDIFVIDNTVWVGTNFNGYDLKTGELKRELTWKGDRVGMPHHRCYRNKATEDFIFTGRSGIEVVSLEDGWQGNNSWIRGTCQYGIMPSNGLLYAPPDACACFLKVKVPGFFAAAPRRAEPTEAEQQMPRLEKGPAYGQAKAPTTSTSSDWPMYRQDVARSGSASTNVPKTLKKNWSVGIGGRLTQPVVAGGRMIVASTDAHTLYTLDAADGKTLWTYTVGGRIDSSPTLYKGTVLFGSADGWVYCLRAADGSLAWRFRAAPQERQAGVFEQLESVWPVHGAVLVQNDTLYVTAGRTSYLDGGIVLYRIDPTSGKQLSRTPVYHLDPETSRQTGVEPTQGFDMEGTGSDILVGDGESVFLRHFTFDRNGREIDEKIPHLFSITGLPLEEWFVRSYWILGTQTGAGWGAWARTVGQAPTARILSFDENHVYGYGRETISSAAVGHRADAYHLFSKNRIVTPPEPAAAGPKNQRRGNAKPKTPAPAPVWSDAQSLIVRAMVLAGDRLVIAGPPDLTEKDPALLAYQNEEEAIAGFRGERGVLLRVVSTSDGATLSEQKLPAMPTFDGMSAADGSVFISLRDGTVQCWGE